MTLRLTIAPNGDRVGSCIACHEFLHGRRIALTVDGKPLCPQCADGHVRGIRWLLDLTGELADLLPRLETADALDAMRDIVTRVSDSADDDTPDHDLLH